MNNYEQALVNYEKAIDIHSSLNDIKGRADINLGLGIANLGSGNIEIAEQFILQSLSLYKSFDLNTGLEKCYRALYEIKKKQELPAEALKYLEITEKLVNDISKEKNRRNLNMLNAKMNFEKEKEELIIANDLTISKQKKYIQWSLVALSILSIFAVLILRANAREKRLIKNLETQAIALNENHKSLQNINNNQDRLFSIVGHDLRSPIISLKGLLDLYLEDPNGKDYFEKFAPQLREDLEQLQFTMDNLLHWGKTQMQGYSIHMERIDVKKELESILQLFRKEIENKSLVLNNLMIKEYYVFADLDQFNVILRNLISNAIKFTPEHGKISVSSKKQKSNVLIIISDTGVGMTEETIKKIFINTEHFTTFGTNMEKGTGLGLRLAKQMAGMNNGDIYVKSQLGKGTEFIIELPIATS
jgi:signal transduction histidine kinase